MACQIFGGWQANGIWTLHTGLPFTVRQNNSLNTFNNLDFSLFKNFQIKESMKLQFRAEMFNIFNTPNFNPPNNFLSAATQFLPSASGGSFPSQIRDQGPGQITSLALPMR